MTSRNYNQEHQDNSRKYAYDFDQNLRHYVIRQLKPLFRAGPALEMGCYKGDFTLLLQEAFDDLSVIEGASDLVEIARSRVATRVRFHLDRFEIARLDRQFANIFIVHALEHLDDPVEVLRHSGSWLQPGGRFFIVVPNANAASRQIAVEMGLIASNAAVTPAEREHGHRATYSLDTLQNVVRQAGLRIEATGGIFFKPLANFQFDKLIANGMIGEDYLEGCYRLGFRYPDLCASIFAVASAA